jgi:tetratricopeptide (TPR) repeat protein
MCITRQLVAFLWFGIVSALAAAAASQEMNAPVQPPRGQVVGWHDCVHQYGQAVMLVGNPEHCQGTAFVISSKHRLLATNAHVADSLYREGAMVARCNGTTATYTVDRVWYHPGVIRRHDQSLMIRCQDPSHGDVAFACPDVAVLHIADGPELPAEFPMATPSELNDLIAQPVAMLGFPCCDTTRWPEAAEKPQASFREGAVTRVAPLRGSDNRECRQQQHVQHSISSWFGASGSPIFVPSGHVVAIDTEGGQFRRSDRTTDVAFGVRIDCLWELLAYHNLTDQVALPAGIGDVNLVCYQQIDPQDAKSHSAMALVNTCNRLMLRGDFGLAYEHCNQAILLAPTYAKVLRVRSNVLREYVGVKAAHLSSADKSQLLRKALEDIQRYREAAPQDPWGVLDYFCTVIWVDSVTKGSPSNPQVVSVITKLIDSGILDQTQRAYALFIRAAAVNYDSNCQTDLAEAIRLAPNGLAGAAAYNARASFWQVHGFAAQSASDSQRATALLQAERLAATAQETLDRPQLTREDLNKAHEMLMEACRITAYNCWQYTQLVASVQHKLGDDTAAVAWATKALSLAPDVDKPRIRMELAAYSANTVRLARSVCKIPSTEDSADPNRLVPVSFSGVSHP